MFLPPNSLRYGKHLDGYQLISGNRGDNGRPHGDPLYATRSRKPRVQTAAVRWMPFLRRCKLCSCHERMIPISQMLGVFFPRIYAKFLVEGQRDGRLL